MFESLVITLIGVLGLCLILVSLIAKPHVENYDFYKLQLWGCLALAAYAIILKSYIFIVLELVMCVVCFYYMWRYI